LQEAQAVSRILSDSPSIDKQKRVGLEEFRERQGKVIEAITRAGVDAAFVYSDEHYNGDVPYLAGNTNITIEPVAGVIGKNGFHVLVFPLGIYEFLVNYLGDPGQVVDLQEAYFKIKYEKSPKEMELTRDAGLICDEMLKCMLAVLKPGMLETQVSAWGYLVGQELGAEEMGFDVMVTTGEANRTLIGKALNRVIHEGDIVHLGVAPKRDGLTACERVSVVCTRDPDTITKQQRYWFDFVEQAYEVGLEAYRKVAKENLPAKLQEQALVDYFRSREKEAQDLLGKKVDLVKQKPYTGTHNAGYTECQEFYGAITLNSNEPLGYRIVTMLDVAIRGVGNHWDDIVIPGLDFVVVERTLGKTGPQVEVLTKLPTNVQHLVGQAYS